MQGRKQKSSLKSPHIGIVSSILKPKLTLCYPYFDVNSNLVVYFVGIPFKKIVTEQSRHSSVNQAVFNVFRPKCVIRFAEKMS